MNWIVINGTFPSIEEAINRIHTIRDMQIDGDEIYVELVGGSIHLDLGEFCTWYNDCYADATLFKPLVPDQMTLAPFSEVMLYLRHVHGIETCFENYQDE